MENQASCTSLSGPDTEACRLPLLDGETSGSAENITTEVRLENASSILNVCRRDKIRFSSTVCTAWALLLRCYTGQDRVTFEYTTDNASATASFLRMDFGEDEILSKHTESARDVITGIEQKRLVATRLSAASVNYETASPLVNTAVCICDSEMRSGMLAKTAEKSIEVSGYTCGRKTISTVSLMTQLRDMSYC